MSVDARLMPYRLAQVAYNKMFQANARRWLHDEISEEEYQYENQRITNAMVERVLARHKLNLGEENEQ